MLLSVVNEEALPAAYPVPPRPSDWCGSAPAFLTAGWRGADKSSTVTTTVGNKRRMLAPYTALLTSALHGSTATAAPYQVEDEQAAAALLVRRHSTRRHHRQPLQQQQPPSTPHSADAATTAAPSAASDVESERVAAAGVLESPLAVLPRPIRRPLPSSTSSSGGRSGDSAHPAVGDEMCDERVRDSASSGRRRAVAAGGGNTFESFDYDTALRSEEELRRSDQSAQPTASDRRQQRKQSSQHSPSPPTAAFSRSSRYSGRSRGRQFKA